MVRKKETDGPKDVAERQKKRQTCRQAEGETGKENRDGEVLFMLFVLNKQARSVALYHVPIPFRSPIHPD